RVGRISWPRLGMLVLLVLLLIQIQCSQRNADVLYAAIPSWADSALDGGDGVPPLRIGDISRAVRHIHLRRSPPPRRGDADTAGGHIALSRQSPNGIRGSPYTRCSNQKAAFWVVVARAPPPPNTLPR